MKVIRKFDRRTINVTPVYEHINGYNRLLGYRSECGNFLYGTEEIEFLADAPPKPAIDWEQRRYEIAKDVMSALVAYIVPNSKGAFSYKFEAQVAIQCADELIKQLRKETGNE